MSLKINGTNSSVTLTAEANAGGYNVELPKQGVGKVLQVVHTNLKDTVVVSTMTDTEIGLSLSITPKSTTSKILVRATLHGSASGNSESGLITIYKDGVLLSDASGTPAGSRRGCFMELECALHTNGTMVSNEYEDSPATTSAITYSIRVAEGTVGYPIYINRTEGDGDAPAYYRGVSTITLMEIAG